MPILQNRCIKQLADRSYYAVGFGGHKQCRQPTSLVQDVQHPKGGEASCGLRRDDRPSLLVEYAQWKIKSDWLDLNLTLFVAAGQEPMANKLTSFARDEVKKLRQRESDLHAHAKNIIDAYHKTIDLFEAGVKKIAAEEAELRAELADMGNGGPLLEEAFSDAKPSEAAHLAEVKAG